LLYSQGYGSTIPQDYPAEAIAMNTGYSRPLPDPTATLYAGEDTLQRMVNAAG
jgi:hypothetical protein